MSQLISNFLLECKKKEVVKREKKEGEDEKDATGKRDETWVQVPKRKSACGRPGTSWVVKSNIWKKRKRWKGVRSGSQTKHQGRPDPRVDSRVKGQGRVGSGRPHEGQGRNASVPRYFCGNTF
ncbi:hypothetical protein GGU10DRAFT_332796 [Lentinula aff. detonsa]|uniref:Uncharacterized protein n=1 Tax=Lentinula aff. detonsa TaxID=2804958 RepID=A0AA38KGG6_9AGAR|nr:hypothetical protein GGU10DRAFT_332796 [Lentinula aff. detonsa]